MRKRKFLAKALSVCLICSLAINCIAPPKKTHAVAIGGAVAIGEVAMDIAVPLMMVYLLNQYGIVVLDGSDRQALVDFGREKIVDFEAWLAQTETDGEYEKPKSKEVDSWLKRGWLGGLEKVGNVYHYFTMWIDSLVADYQPPSEDDNGVIEVVNTRQWIDKRMTQISTGYPSRTSDSIKVVKDWGRMGFVPTGSGALGDYHVMTPNADRAPMVFYLSSGNQYYACGLDSNLGSYNYVGVRNYNIWIGAQLEGSYYGVSERVPLPDGRKIYVSGGGVTLSSSSSYEFSSQMNGVPVYHLDYPTVNSSGAFLQAVGEMLWYVREGLPLPPLADETPGVVIPQTYNYTIDERTLNIYNNYHSVRSIEIYPKTGDKDVTVKVLPSGKYSDLLEPYTTVFGTVPINIDTGYTIADGEPTVFAPMSFPDYQYSLPLIWTKFPFSILEDIGLLYEKLKAEPQAPHFELDVPLSDEPLVVDMENWNDLAITWRKLELMLVVVGLICVTMGFIGGGKND